MDISTIKSGVFSLPQASTPGASDAAHRRELIQAVRSVNISSVLGHNQLVFLIDRQTHRPVIRVEDRETHEVLMQLPPEYVLRLADELHAQSAQVSQSSSDM